MDVAALAAKRNEWKNSLPADQQAALTAEVAAFENEESKAERMAEMTATF